MDNNDYSDEELFEQYDRGLAFHILVHRYLDQLYTYCYYHSLLSRGIPVESIIYGAVIQVLNSQSSYLPNCQTDRLARIKEDLFHLVNVEIESLKRGGSYHESA